uniref:Copine C-terminal domain-containing protein n=1 Tax=Sus scrofa TaxID=9823 RepID=A0A4X1TCT8_PIG
MPPPEAVVRTAHPPVSLLAMGVGNADVADKQVLDSDNGALRSPCSETSSRQDGGWKHPPFTRQVSPTVLAKSVLAEVPGQLVEYSGAQHPCSREQYQPGPRGAPSPA